MIHIKSSSVYIFPLILSCLSSCAGEDRSGERPLVPVVETLEAEVVADSLQDGEYYYAAYARNGIGTTYGDTLYFTVNNKKK